MHENYRDESRTSHARAARMGQLLSEVTVRDIILPLLFFPLGPAVCCVRAIRITARTDPSLLESSRSPRQLALTLRTEGGRPSLGRGACVPGTDTQALVITSEPNEPITFLCLMSYWFIWFGSDHVDLKKKL